jgi:hypothetical protein
MSTTGEESSVSVTDPHGAGSLMDLWKRSEYLKFQEYLGNLEAERSSQVRDELGRIKKIERKLKLKLIELENKERDLVGQESELRRAREETALRLKRQADDHQGAIQLLKEQHATALKIEREKLKAEEAKRRALELESAAHSKNNKPSRGRNVVKETEDATTALRDRIRELETELKLKNVALDQSKEREAVLLKSRDHFRAAVLRMTCDSQQAKTCNEEIVIRLQQKRAELIASGLYIEEDEVIRQIDQKIVKALT